MNNNYNNLNYKIKEMYALIKKVDFEEIPSEEFDAYEKLCAALHTIVKKEVL